MVPRDVMQIEKIKIMVLDVDGVLTPGDVTFDEGDGRVMSFDIQDGYAIKLWRGAGHRVAILSGRSSPIVDRRASELGIDLVYQGVADKHSAYRELLGRLEAGPAAACCMGDDLPDVGLLGDCGFAVAVANAVAAVKRCADYVTRRPGGRGAVAEVVELILRRQNRWRQLVDNA